MPAGEQQVSVPVIDMWAPIVPSWKIIADLRSGFPAEQLQYLEVFTKTSVSEEQFGEYAQTLRRTDDQRSARKCAHCQLHPTCWKRGCGATRPGS